MRLRDLQNVVGLRDRLDTLNRQISDLWKFSNHEKTATLFGHVAAGLAETAAKKAIRQSLVSQRDDVLLSLSRYGITFDEEESE
jgi:hypothetical protein